MSEIVDEAEAIRQRFDVDYGDVLGNPTPLVTTSQHSYYAYYKAYYDRYGRESPASRSRVELILSIYTSWDDILFAMKPYGGAAWRA